MLVIADEAHHLGEDLAWGEAFSRAFGGCARWLLLSGTPFRSDTTPIPGVRYDAHGLAEPDISYSYADAVLDGICRPVCFVAYDGTLSWRSGDDVIESSFETVSERARGRPPLPHGDLDRTSRRAAADPARSRRQAPGTLRARWTSRCRWPGHRRGLEPRAPDRRAAAPGDRAAGVGRAPHRAEGRREARCVHQCPRPWIVAVNMVSEGVDIPRLRVGVYASAAKTPFVFRQIVGRFVRTIPQRPAEPSWLYIPADRILRDHAAGVQQELRHALRPTEDEYPAEFDRAERTRDRARVRRSCSNHSART